MVTRTPKAAWGAIDADVTARFQNLSINPKYTVSTLSFESAIKPDSLDIQTFNAQINDAFLQGTIRSDYSALAKPTYQNHLNISLKNLKAENFIHKKTSWKLNGIF